MSEARPVTVDSLPTTAEIWDVLRRLYGTRMIGATLVSIIDNDGHVTVHTTTFPQEKP